MDTKPISTGGWYFYKDGHWEEAESYNKIVAERDEARAWARRYYALYQRARIETYLDIQAQNRLRKELARCTKDALFVNQALRDDCKRLRDERNHARLLLLGLVNPNTITQWCPHCGGNRFVDALDKKIHCKDCFVVEENQR